MNELPDNTEIQKVVPFEDYKKLEESFKATLQCLPEEYKELLTPFIIEIGMLTKGMLQSYADQCQYSMTDANKWRHKYVKMQVAVDTFKGEANASLNKMNKRLA